MYRSPWRFGCMHCLAQQDFAKQQRLAQQDFAKQQLEQQLDLHAKWDKWAKRLIRLSLQSVLKAALHHGNNKALHIAFRRNIDISIDLSPYPYHISQAKPQYIEVPSALPQDAREYYATDIMPKNWKFNKIKKRRKSKPPQDIADLIKYTTETEGST